MARVANRVVPAPSLRDHAGVFFVIGVQLLAFAVSRDGMFAAKTERAGHAASRQNTLIPFPHTRHLIAGVVPLGGKLVQR